MRVQIFSGGGGDVMHNHDVDSETCLKPKDIE